MLAILPWESDMMVEKQWLVGFCCAAFLAATSTPFAQAAEKKIVLNGKFGQIVSDSIAKPGFPEGEHDVELGQEVRIDSLASDDPEWDGAKVTVYEQNLSYPSHGTYRTFGLISNKAGETAFLELDGKWNVVSRDGKFVEAPFDGQGKLLGGTGKLAGVSGSVLVKGNIGADATGAYSVEITADH